MHCRLEVSSTENNNNVKLFLGNHVQLNDYVPISAIESVQIGDDVLMASQYIFRIIVMKVIRATKMILYLILRL